MFKDVVGFRLCYGQVQLLHKKACVLAMLYHRQVHCLASYTTDARYVPQTYVLDAWRFDLQLGVSCWTQLKPCSYYKVETLLYLQSESRCLQEFITAEIRSSPLGAIVSTQQGKLLYMLSLFPRSIR